MRIEFRIIGRNYKTTLIIVAILREDYTPIKLPVKVLGIVKYIAVGLGIIESVLEKDKAEEEDDAA